MAAKIKKGDRVIILAGSDKGRQGDVLRVYANDRVLVEGVNVVKRHTKPNPQRNVEGGIIEQEKPIHRSNVALIDSDSKPSKIGFKTLEDGRKVRYFKSNEEVVDI
jgi:large subunit ribosomal protein L24